MEFTLVTEAFNLTDGEGFLLSPTDDSRVPAVVERSGGRVRLLSIPGGGYDPLKNFAAHTAFLRQQGLPGTPPLGAPAPTTPSGTRHA